jgi:hypothetical protein
MACLRYAHFTFGGRAQVALDDLQHLRAAAPRHE